MGSIEKRGKSSWRLTALVKTPSGTLPVRTTIRMDPALPESVQRRDAQRELRNLEKRLGAELSDSLTLQDWSAQWLDNLRADCSPVTISNYKYMLNSRILPTLGNRYLAELTPVMLSSWLSDLRKSKRKTTRKAETQLRRARRESEEKALLKPKQMEKPLSAKTALNYYGCLSSCLAAAVRLGHIDFNPMDRVQRPRQKKNHKHRLTEDEAVQIVALLSALPDESRCFRLAALLALLCGLRLGEVTDLRYNDIDWKRGTIKINHALKYTSDTGTITADPKTDSAVRVITLPESMLDLLKEARQIDSWAQEEMSIEDAEAGRDLRWVGRGHIIHGRYGARMNKDTPSKWFRRFADKNGFPGVTFHDLRHAHASILVAHNLDIAAIAARMGHSDATVTLSTYTHPFAAQDQRAAEILDNLLKRPEEK